MVHIVTIPTVALKLIVTIMVTVIKRMQDVIVTQALLVNCVSIDTVHQFAPYMGVVIMKLRNAYVTRIGLA
jgi:hypothetical protein